MSERDPTRDVPSRAPTPIKGRGAVVNPRGRFERLEIVYDPEHANDPAARPKTELLRDVSRSVLSTNDSPDLPFDVSLNPYRGCEHGCSYCYARPTHEYLGLSAGLDFETKILVKENAPELLRRELSSRRWRPQVIALSGVTDPYQPVERKLGITRRCLEVLAELRNPVAIVTKNHLVTRDLDLLRELAEHNAAIVLLSVTSLDPELSRQLEPRASHPRRRLDAVRELISGGVPAGVMIAPVIPALNDHEVPAILEAAAQAGAQVAHYILLRLPYNLKEQFETWLRQHRPDRADKVMNRLREQRDGRLNDAKFGRRMRGTGVYADQLEALFKTTRRRLSIGERTLDLSIASFRRPGGEQIDLFGAGSDGL